MSKYVVWRKGTMNKTYIYNNTNNTNNTNNMNSINNDKNIINRFETDTIMKTQLNEWKESSLKKSTLSKRLSNRDQIGNISRNPYLINNNYLEDLKNQDIYLRPKMSSFEAKE